MAISLQRYARTAHHTKLWLCCWFWNLNKSESSKLPTRNFSNKRNSEQKFETAKQHLINSCRSLFQKFPIHYRLFNFHLGVPGRAGADGIPGKEGNVSGAASRVTWLWHLLAKRCRKQFSVVTRECHLVTNVFSITSLIPFFSRRKRRDVWNWWEKWQVSIITPNFQPFTEIFCVLIRQRRQRWSNRPTWITGPHRHSRAKGWVKSWFNWLLNA